MRVVENRTRNAKRRRKTRLTRSRLMKLLELCSTRVLKINKANQKRPSKLKHPLLVWMILRNSFCQTRTRTRILKMNTSPNTTARKCMFNNSLNRQGLKFSTKSPWRISLRHKGLNWQPRESKVGCTDTLIHASIMSLPGVLFVITG